MCISVADVKVEMDRMREHGVNVQYESGAPKYFMAFITDPDGYEIEYLNDQQHLQCCSK